MKSRKSLFTAAAVTAFACSLAFGQQQAGQQPPPPAQQQEQQPSEQPPPPQDPQQAGELPPPPPQQGQQEFGQPPPRGQQEQQAQQQQQQGKQQQQAILGDDISDEQVQSQDGQQLGTLDDLALSLQDGQVAFLLVSEQGQAGGQGAQQWKPIPPEAIQINQQGGQVEITASIGQQEWQNVPTVSEEEIPQLGDQAQEIYQAFNQQPDPQQQGSQLTLASKLMEETLSNQEGKEIGQIIDVVLDTQGKQLHFIVIQPEGEQGRFAAAPDAVQQTGEGQFELNLQQEDFQQAQELKMAEAGQQAQQAQSGGGQQVFRLEASQQAGVYGSPEQRRQRGGQQGAEIQVQQRSPQVEVRQPEPEVRVRQPQPEVQVKQPDPEVRVQQPEPRVRVQQPEPEVSVEQPEPRVRVRQPEPKVQVEQADPQVEVEQQGEPEIYIEREAQEEQRQRRREQR